MEQQQQLRTGRPIHGGRAYQLARLAMAAILVLWFSLIALVVFDKYEPELNNLFLLTIAAIGTLGGAQQIPNTVERLRPQGGRDPEGGARD